MGFRLVPKSVTLNNLGLRRFYNLCLNGAMLSYFALLQ